VTAGAGWEPAAREYAPCRVSTDVPRADADKTALDESVLRERNEALEAHKASVNGSIRLWLAEALDPRS
jgi:hypothetical protein